MGELKNRSHYTTTLLNEYIKTIEKLAIQTSIPKSKLGDEAYKLLFEKYGIEIEKPDSD